MKSLHLVQFLVIFLLSCHFANSLSRRFLPQISFTSEPDPEPESEPEPETHDKWQPEPEPEYEPEPEPEPKPKKYKHHHHDSDKKDFSIGSPGVSLKFDLPSLKIQVPAVKLPGISLKATIKKPGLGLRLFPLNIKLPQLNLATGIGGRFGISSGGQGGLKISSGTY